MLSQSVSMRWSRSSTGSSKISSLLRVLAIISIVAVLPQRQAPPSRDDSCLYPLPSATTSFESSTQDPPHRERRDITSKRTKTDSNELRAEYDADFFRA